MRAFIIIRDKDAKWGQVFYRTLKDAWTRGISKRCEDWRVAEVECTVVCVHDKRPEDKEE